MREQPPDWYWDLTQAAWVQYMANEPHEHRERHDEDEPLEAIETVETVETARSPETQLT